MKKSKLNKMKRGNAKLVLIIASVILVILGISLIFVLKTPSNHIKTKEALCGNNLCENSEGCNTCPEDCKCTENEYCSSEKNECISPICGNGICESFEGPDSCCTDCACTIPAEVCNNNSLICEIPEFPISDERVAEIAKEYSESKGLVVNNTEIVNTREFNGQIIRMIRVYQEGENWFATYGITKDGAVIEIPLY